MASDATAVRVRPVANVVAVTVLLAFSAARLASVWEIEGSGQPLWPASGLVIGLALVVPRRQRVVVAVAGLLGVAADSLFFVRADVWDALGDTVSYGVEIGAGLAAFATLFSPRVRLGRTNTTIVAFVLCFAIPAVASLPSVAWFAPADPFEYWWAWTLGHGLGIAAPGAAVLLLRGPGRWMLDAHPREHTTELAAATLITTLITVWAFAGRGEATFLVLGCVLWLAIRFGPRVGMPAALLVVVFASIRSSQGAGHFGSGTNSDLLNLHTFNATVVFSTSLVARYSRGLDRERRRTTALLGAIPDIVTLTSSRSGRIIPMDLPVSDDEKPLRHAVAERLREDPPRPPLHGHVVKVEEFEAGPTTPLRIESRSVLVDRDTVLTISRDVGEVLRLLDELQHARDRWKRLALTAYEGFVEIDASMTITFATERMAEMLGTTVGDLVGGRFGQMWTPTDWQRIEPHAQLVARGERATFETDYERRDGSRAWAILSGEPIMKDGVFRGGIMFAAETTDYHRESEGRAVAEMRLATVEQRERQRIARAIHDGPLQSMVALSYQLHTVAADTANTLGETLERLAIDGVRGLRQAIEDLSPIGLTDGEIVPALARVAERFSTADSPTVSFETTTEAPLSVESATALFRLGREGLVNALLHSGATEIHVEITSRTDSGTITVSDNGVGIDHDHVDSADGHLGIRAMRERAAEIGGNCQIASISPSGTRVTASVPNILDGEEAVRT